jgi:hypothetical protein
LFHALVSLFQSCEKVSVQADYLLSSQQQYKFKSANYPFMRHSATNHITVVRELYSSPNLLLTFTYACLVTISYLRFSFQKYVNLWACSIITALHTLTTGCGEIYVTVWIHSATKWSSENETNKRYICHNTVTEIQT